MKFARLSAGGRCRFPSRKKRIPFRNENGDGGWRRQKSIAKRLLIFQVPMVRIHLPPAASLRTFGPGAAGDRCKVRLDAGEGASAWPGGNWRFAGTSRLKSLVLPA